ncbi:hypothetical protein WJX72_008379 [[Myrmecia] bisecta]|uniref:Dephospho-CoA kinase n=1 Tax=[Myrmecia] bisecta TaxID=41462 RepID=A0AAW1PKJ7_9CHLO
MAADGNRRPYVLGLTGSIGMGKSTVAKMFTTHGVPVLDADKVVHDLYAAGGAAVEPVGEAFPGVVDNTGAISRPALSKAVLSNEAAFKKLESIVHPLVAAERHRFLEQLAQEGQQVVVLDIPLLYETGGEKQVDAVVVVSAPADVQKQRVLARPGMDPDRFEGILKRQVPDTEKRQRSDFVIDTGVSFQETEQQVTALITDIIASRRPDR